MKIISTKQDMAAAVSIVAEAISKSPVVSIISGIYMEAEDNMLTLIATDTITSLIAKIPVKVEVPGKTVLPGLSLSNLLKDLPSGEVSISQQEQFCLLKYGKGAEATLNTMPPKEFPQLNLPQDEALNIEPSLFQLALDKVVPTINPNDEQRPTLSGVYFDFLDGYCYLVGTDTHRLSRMQCKLNNTQLEPFIATVHTIKIAAKLFKSEEPIKMWHSKNQIVFSNGAITVLGRLLGQKYVNYTHVIPKNSSTSLKFKNSELLETVERAHSLKTKTLQLMFSGGLCKITAKNDYGSINESVNITDYNSEPLELYVSTTYLKDALRCIEKAPRISEEITMQLNGKSGPMVFECQEYLHILLPCN